MNTLGIITARSGSRRIKDKNICDLNGQPLMAYSIESALKSEYINEVMVSTDSQVYANIAIKYGAKVPFLRSKKNSTDLASSIDVLLEVLDEYEKCEKYFDNIILLQPTSPLRTNLDIDNAFKIFIEKQADSIVSVCECTYSPLLCNTLRKDFNMFDFINNEANCSKSLEKYYRLNGAIYISKVCILRKIHSFYGKNSYAYMMDRIQSVDIDTEFDLRIAEAFLNYEKEKKDI